MRLNDWKRDAEQYQDIDRAIQRELEARMYVYIKSESAGKAGAVHDLYTVGFYDPQGKWHADSDHSTGDEAAARVHYLNGGEDETNTTPYLLAGEELRRAERARRG